MNNKIECNCKELVSAVILQALTDYKIHFRSIKRKSHNIAKYDVSELSDIEKDEVKRLEKDIEIEKSHLREIEKFFLSSPWISWADIEGLDIIKALKKEGVMD